MNKPFDLPEGLEWRELDEQDRSWWCGNGRGSYPMGRGIPLERCASFSITYTLRHVDTGEERVVNDRWIPFDITTDPDEELRGVSYQYTEGNFGCGCNRSIFWALAGGEAHPGDDVSCDQRFEIVSPRWLAELDEDPWLRSEDPPPWRAAN